MKIRKLLLKDAPLMLSWMHDTSVTSNLATDFSSKTIEDCRSFIIASRNWQKDVNCAIVSDDDEYMGTVSLKHINYPIGYAEFAIAIRKEAMGFGYSWFGMKEILKKAFDCKKLKKVFWCVRKDNLRAIRFYDKHLFRQTSNIPDELIQCYTAFSNLKWYYASEEDLAERRNKVLDCELIRLRTIKTNGIGQLSFFEGSIDFPFEIKRMYYITNVSDGTKRGFHAHKELKQLIFCPYGRILLILENELGREEIELNDPSIGVLITKPTWREMIWLQKDSVLCVAASDYYKPNDYIRDIDEFHNFLKGEAK